MNSTKTNKSLVNSESLSIAGLRSAGRFILGTVQFGMPYGINNSAGRPSDDNVFQILDHAYASGIRQLDTADVYGQAQPLIGKYLRQSGNTFLINTKFRVDENISIPEQLEQTLEELSVKKIHSYFYHRFSELVDYPGSGKDLMDLKSAGLIEKIGVSVYTNEEFKTCIASQIIDVIQLPFNLLDNYSKRGELLQEAVKCGKEIQVRSVFLQGLFFKEPGSFPGKLEPLKKHAIRLKELASENGISIQDLAIAYVLNKQEIDHVIIGVDTKEQLEANLSALEIHVDQSLEAEIDNIIVKEESLLYPFNWK